MQKMLRIFITCIVGLLLTACEQKSHQDVVDFIAESKRKQPGKVAALPPLSPYKPYVYSGAQKRSPFEPPAVVERKVLAAKSNVKPDLNRQKQRLESFDFSSLSMVGTIKRGDVIWALIRDPQGSIDRVKTGYYLGRNHGRIVALDNQGLDVIEIVPNGLDGWLERPNRMIIREKE